MVLPLESPNRMAARPAFWSSAAMASVLPPLLSTATSVPVTWA